MFYPSNGHFVSGRILNNLLRQHNQKSRLNSGRLVRRPRHLQINLDIFENYEITLSTDTRVYCQDFVYEKSEKSSLHAKCTYGTLVRVSPSFHHHLSQNLLSSTFAPLWTYDENTEYSYNLWMEATRGGIVEVSVCSANKSPPFVYVFKTEYWISDKLSIMNV